MKHLNQEQISAWLIGDRTLEQSSHLERCEACRAEVERLERSLGAFRDSVKSWSDRQPIHNHPWAAPSRWQFFPAMAFRWAGGVALAVALIGVPVYEFQHQKVLKAEQARQDAALLEAVNYDLDRSAPRSFEALDNLVDWKSPATETGSKQ